MKKVFRFQSFVAILTATVMLFTLTMGNFHVQAKANENGISDFVTRLYKVCLDRNPDNGGLDYWCAKLIDKKGTGISVAYGFVFSNEFQGRNFSNKEYVEHLYEAFFGRAADEEGLKYWVENLENGGTKEDIFAGFANSEEFYNLCKSYDVIRGTYFKGYNVDQTAQVNLFVERLYNEILERDSDLSGFVDWSRKLVTHESTGAEVAYGFVFSQEVSNKKLSNEEFVIMLYASFLGRTPDEAGKWSWIDKLDFETTDNYNAPYYARKDAFAGFVGSQEFAGICKAYGIETGFDSLLDANAPHEHNYVYAEYSTKRDVLVLDPAIDTVGYVYGSLNASYLRAGDFPEGYTILGSGHPGPMVYNGIFRLGRKIDDTHFEVSFMEESGITSGDVSLATDQTGDIIDLTKLDWYCIHRGTQYIYQCSVCGEYKDKTIHSGGGVLPSVGTHDSYNPTFTRDCTCYDKIIEQYGVLFVRKQGEIRIEKKDGQTGYYTELFPYEIKFSRCKHENVADYVYKYRDYSKLSDQIEEHSERIWRAISYDTFYRVGEKQYYLECLDCGAILPNYND